MIKCTASRQGRSGAETLGGSGVSHFSVKKRCLINVLYISVQFQCRVVTSFRRSPLYFRTTPLCWARAKYCVIRSFYMRGPPTRIWTWNGNLLRWGCKDLSTALSAAFPSDLLVVRLTVERPVEALQHIRSHANQSIRNRLKRAGSAWQNWRNTVPQEFENISFDAEKFWHCTRLTETEFHRSAAVKFTAPNWNTILCAIWHHVFRC